MSNTKELVLSDKLNIKDGLNGRSKLTGTHMGFKTDILCTDEIGQTIFHSSNSSVIGGALFTLEKLFGVQSALTIATLNEIMGFGNSGPSVIGMPADNTVCLFGVGTGGAGDSAVGSVYDVDFKDRELPSMIPFRVTSTELSTTDKDLYFGKKTLVSGKNAFYLKKFETTPTIKALWLDGADGEDGSAVGPNVHTSERTEGIETFIEMNLKINKNDCREWFDESGEIEKARVNTIGLFSAVPSTLDDGSVEYKNVKLFSMLNINSEVLSSSKELNLRYRVYSA